MRVDESFRMAWQLCCHSYGTTVELTTGAPLSAQRFERPRVIRSTPVSGMSQPLPG